MANEVIGKIDRVLFRDDNNGYSVLKVKTANKYITVTGNFLEIETDKNIKFYGEWINHPKYGEQFKSESYEVVLPTETEEIKDFLASGNIKGIGPSLAERIVERFGKQTFEVLDNDINRLRGISGIGKKKFNEISEVWNKQKVIRDIFIFLRSHGLSGGIAVKIFKKYGSNAIDYIKENPYRLIEEVFGVGFLKADKLAHNLGIPYDSPYRIEAAIIYLLNELAMEGNTCYLLEDFVGKCQQSLSVDTTMINDNIHSLKEQGKVVLEEITSKHTGKSLNLIFLEEYHTAEVESAEKLHHISSYPSNLQGVNKEEIIKEVIDELNIDFVDEQIEAIRASLENKVTVITGGPGTGKTTIIKAILKIFKSHEFEALLAAPTGRAAKKMTDATGYTAKTIHRLLEYNPMTNSFNRDEDLPLETDVLIIDETSMVDTLLLWNLLKATPPETIVILVGDVDQLPSVGAGNVLADIINSQVIKTIRLRKIFRQAEKSAIVTNAHKINNGEMPVLTNNAGELNDFIFERITSPEDILDRVMKLLTIVLPDKYGYNGFNDVQVLSPMHRGTVGVKNLNNEIQSKLNPDGKEVYKGEHQYRIGDKVMQIKNNYVKDVYNGDIGKIINYHREERYVLVNFDEKFVKYDVSELDELNLAYAVTVHKSQGSEYPVIIMPIIRQHYRMLQRNLLYTAISRGRKLVILLGVENAVSLAVNNKKAKTRYTFLRPRLQEIF